MISSPYALYWIITSGACVRGLYTVLAAAGLIAFKVVALAVSHLGYPIKTNSPENTVRQARVHPTAITLTRTNIVRFPKRSPYHTLSFHWPHPTTERPEQRELRRKFWRFRRNNGTQSTGRSPYKDQSPYITCSNPVISSFLTFSFLFLKEIFSYSSSDYDI